MRVLDGAVVTGTVGVVRVGPHDLSDLKREVLLFERLALFQRTVRYGNVTLVRTEADRDEWRARLADGKWLQEQGIAFSVDDITPTPELAAEPAYQTLRSEFIAKNDELAQRVPVGEVRTNLQVAEALYGFAEAIHPVDVRTAALWLRRVRGLDALPVLHAVPPTLDAPADKQHLVNVVLKALPLPGPDVSFDQLLEFRSDHDARSSLLDLRNWASDTARAGWTVREAAEKLEWLHSQFERHMAIHRLKTESTVFQTFVTSSADFAEQVLKFKFGDIARKLFSIKQYRIQMKEAELSAPGSEVAYILKARRRFGRQGLP